MIYTTIATTTIRFRVTVAIVIIKINYLSFIECLLTIHDK